MVQSLSLLTRMGIMETVYIGGVMAANHSFLRCCCSVSTGSWDMGSAVASETANCVEVVPGPSALLAAAVRTPFVSRCCLALNAALHLARGVERGTRGAT